MSVPLEVNTVVGALDPRNIPPGMEGLVSELPSHQDNMSV